jgi:hypothetical protein
MEQDKDPEELGSWLHEGNDYVMMNLECRNYHDSEESTSLMHLKRPWSVNFRDTAKNKEYAGISRDQQIMPMTFFYFVTHPFPS